MYRCLSYFTVVEKGLGEEENLLTLVREREGSQIGVMELSPGEKDPKTWRRRWQCVPRSQW